VERDDGEAPAGRQQVPGGVEAAVEAVELLVHRDPQRLEDALGGVAAGEQGGRGDGGAHHLHQVAGGGDRVLRAAAHDGPRDLARVPLLAVGAHDVGEVALGRLGHQVGGGGAPGGVHPHVERRLARV
jgi:hypothetical protein